MVMLIDQMGQKTNGHLLYGVDLHCCPKNCNMAHTFAMSYVYGVMQWLTCVMGHIISPETNHKKNKELDLPTDHCQALQGNHGWNESMKVVYR